MTQVIGRPAVVAMPAEAVYCLRLGDDALVMAQRLGEWLSRSPQIEEDMALGNVGLDLLGQARALLTHAGELVAASSGGELLSEDDLAYWRDERAFCNVHLVEQERGDFGRAMATLLWFAAYQHALWSRLVSSTDEVVAAVAAKAVKEVDYHRDHATQWVLRLGDGTPESHDRMQAGLEAVAPYVEELFDDDDLVRGLAERGVAVLPSSLRAEVEAYVDAVLAEATLTRPASGWRSRGGRDGIHSAPMGLMLAEMQHLARSHPGATW